MKKLLLLFAFALSQIAFAQQKPKYNIIAYYTGNSERLQQYPLDKLTHLIYSFVKLRNDTLMLRDAKQEQNVLQIVALKKKYPQLKIMVSMGGWSGCAPCSDLFAAANHRKIFAKTTVALLKKYNLDGLDLDWEYPAIEGFPGHKFQKADRDNFTELVKVLRAEMGTRYLLTFAAGGFVKYLEESVDWPKVHPLVDFINLMTYDLVGGYATVTGHHTPLYGYRKDQESTDKCVNWLLKHKIPANKLITGAAIYGRVWEKVAPINNGLYQSGVFKQGVSFKDFNKYFSDTAGFQYFWDEKAKAPYQYNPAKQLFATFDNEKSIAAKANYVKQKKLGGIMFWELIDDKSKDGLVEEMWKVLGK
ncbi:glycoside hydrolase family 18 protein [Pedobacter frigiditerrae]|uniref:chitinase n=1 Tax=Pedobacter frigiditerrae TaxID=2530452 RepID=A0A4R0MTL1_9SPHI|nr:glycoside hydrolase family 18 protein [Pedobacter frigiditerrae]TCC89274.1 glycoside hydrolase family 18 protein [Pedobacter frigiditerrae]